MIVASLAAVCLLPSSQTFGASDDEVETTGMIISRTGETLILNSPNGKVTVVLTGETETKDKRGLFGLNDEHMSNTVLIPGLKVKVEGMSDNQGRLTAKEITVDDDDLETAEMIQSGLHPTAEQVAANMQAIEANKKNVATNQGNIEENQQNIAAIQQKMGMNSEQFEKNVKDVEENTNRFTALADYEVKAAATVNFDVGSAKISAQDQEELNKVAQTATGLTGYIIEVTGYADSTGSAATNTKLSEDRAKAVVVYLMQRGNVPVRHIVAPGAMGEYGPVSSNETKAGRAGNRRVEIKVLVNKGITGI
jgi:outer membrane protein OmpA-like peptidoglycan-associated protein